VPKSADTVDVASVVRRVANGESVGPPAPAPAAAPPLTERERSILAAVAAGMTTAAISRELWISEHTIKFHLTNIYRKLGVTNRAGAVRFAIENGLAG
jgi:DNA-binding NarL/FixJ family response regulator